MSNICDLSANKNLKESLEKYVNVLIGYKLGSAPVLDYKDITFEIFKSVFKAKGDKVQALAIAYHVPQLVHNVISQDKFYDPVELTAKGYDPTMLLKEIARLQGAEDKINAIAELIAVSDLSYDKIKKLISNTPTDESNVILGISTKPGLESLDKKLMSLSYFNTTGSAAEESEEKKMLEAGDQDKLFVDEVRRRLLSQKGKKDKDFSSVSYGGHTGFAGMLIYENLIPNVDKMWPARKEMLKQNLLALVITDNDGNILYFKDDMTVGDESNGRPVYSMVKSTKDYRFNQMLDAITEKIMQSNKPKGEIDQMIEQAKRRLEAERAFINAARDKSYYNKEGVPVALVGGSKGAYTPTESLTSKIKAEAEAPLSKFTGLTQDEKESIMFVTMEIKEGVSVELPCILFDNFDEPITIKNSSTIGKQDPALLNNIVDVLVEDIEIDGQKLIPQEKIKYARTFINLKQENQTETTLPYAINVDSDTKKVTFVLNNDRVITIDETLSPEAKKAAKEEIKAFLGSNAYVHFHKDSYKSKVYTNYNITETEGVYTGTKSTELYYPFISQKLTPTIPLNKNNGRPMILNSYISFTPIITKQNSDKAAEEVIEKVEEQNIPIQSTSKIDLDDELKRSKLIEAITDAEQEERVQRWWKNSGLSKALDSDGKPLFNLNLLRNVVNSDAWATFSGSTITLYEGSSYTHIYHEAWHAFSQVYLTKADRTKLYKAVSEIPGSFEVVRKIALPGGTNYEKVSVNFADATREELEEFIAEEFRIYAMNNGKFKVKSAKTNIFKKIFDRVWKALKTLLTGTKPAVLYSSPYSGNMLSEMFNVLYSAKKPEQLLPYKPNLANAEFGLLRAGIVNSKGEQELSLSETMLITRSIDGIISQVLTEEVQKAGKFSAVKQIFNSPKSMSQLYYVVREKLTEKLTSLVDERKSLLDKKELSKEEDQKKIVLDNKIRVLSNAVKSEIFGDVNGIIEGKDFASTVVAFHRQNSAYKNMFGKLRLTDTEIVELDEEDIEDALAGKFDVPSNGVASEDLASGFVKYLVSSLVKQDSDGNIQLNELGFPEPIEFKTFWRVLMAKASGETSILGLYNKLKDATSISPLFQQFLDKIYVQQTKQDPITKQIVPLSPEESLAVMFKEGSVIGDIWLDLLQATNLHKTELIAVQVVENIASSTGYDVKVGRTSAQYQTVLKDWESSFQQQPVSSYIKKTKDQVNYLNLERIFDDFIKEDANVRGEPVYTILPEDRYDFLNAIGIFVSPNEELIEDLTEQDVKYFAKIIAQVVNYNRKTSEYNSKLTPGKPKRDYALIKNPVREFASGINLPNGARLANNAFAVNRLAELEAELSDMYVSGMRPTPEGKLKSTHALNSSDTQKIKALRKVNKRADLYSSNSELMHMNYLNPDVNPKAAGLVLLKSLFADNASGEKINNDINVYDLSGTSYIDSEKNSEGVAYAKMSPIDKIATSIMATLAGGYMESITPSDKSSYFSIKTNYIKTYDIKEIGYLYVDTHAFIKDAEGNYIKEYNPMNKVLEIMYPKLEGEIRTIKMVSDNPQLYAKTKGLDRLKDFDIFDEILDSEKNPNLKKELKSKEFYSKLTQAGSLTAVLANPANRDLKKIIDAEIVEYFEKLAERQDKNLFSEAFGVDTALPEVINSIVTKELKSYEKERLISPDDTTDLSDYKKRLREAAVMSYTVNNFIHKTETTVLLQGDGAQFDYSKEEAIKRVPGSQSSGRIYPVDKLAQLLANKFGRPYEKKLLEEDKLTKRSGVKEVRLYDGTLNTAVIAESEVRSEYFDMYRDLFKKDFESKGLKGEALDKALYGFDPETGAIGTADKVYKGGKMHPFSKITAADGQAWISFDTYRLLCRLEGGAWSNDQETAFMKIVNGETLSPTEVTELFPVLKLQENGPLANEGMFPVMSFHKFSLFPLIPSVIKGKPLEQLHNAMLQQDIDYVLLESGSKRSHIKPSAEVGGDEIFVGDSSNIKPADQITLTNNKIYVAYLKKQTSTNTYFKDESTFSTQMRKLLFGNLFVLGAPIDFLSKYKSELEGRDAWNALDYNQKIKQSPIYKKSESFINRLDQYVELEKQELLKDIEFITDQGEEQDEEKKMIAMIKFLRKELKDQGFSDHELSILEASSNTKDVDLSLSPLAPRLEKLAVAVVNNRLVRIKIKGEPFVEVSSEFFQSSRKPVKFQKPTEEQQKQYDNFGTNGLPSYVPDLSGKSATKGFGFKRAFTKSDMGLLNTNYYEKNAEGKYVATGTVAVYDTVKDEQGKESKKLNFEASFARINEMLQVDSWLTDDENYKKIRLTGVRIPVQGDNSIEFGQVAEFLLPGTPPIIVIPAEIVAKSGTDFDVDKMTAYLPYVTRNGKLLEPLTEEQVDKKLEELSNKLDKLKETRTDIKLFKEAKGQAWKSVRPSFNEFRDAIERGSKLIDVDKVMYQALTNKNNRELLKLLNTDENAQKFIKQNFKKAYNIYEKQIKPVSAIELEAIDRELEALYFEKSELSDVYKEFENYQEHKRNIISGVQNGFIDDIIDIMSLPEKAVSLLSPNDVNIVKPYADELKGYIQEADDETDYSKSVKTNKKLHKKGVSSTNIYTEDYNFKKQQELITGKGVLGIAAVDNYINVLLNMAGGKMNKSITAFVNEYDAKSKTIKKSIVNIPITLELAHNKIDGAISLSHALDTNNLYSVADVISQLMNGFLDVGKDAWVAYFHANMEIVPKILFLIEAGVPIGDIAYFVNNPLVREYIKDLKRGKAVLSKIVFGLSHNAGSYKKEAKNYLLENVKLSDEESKNFESTDSLENMYAYSSMLKKFKKKSYFTTDALKEAAKQKPNRKDKAQIAGLIQYLYIEELIGDYDNMKKAFNPDTKTTNDLLTAKIKITDVDNMENAPSLDKGIHKYMTKESVISPLFIQKFIKELYGRVFKLRSNDVVEDFLVNDIGKNKKEKFKAKKMTGYDFETYTNKFRNFIAQYIFINELSQYDSKTKMYKGYEVDDEFLKQANDDFNNFRFLATSKDPNSYVNRGLAPINRMAFPVVIDPATNEIVLQKSEKYRENFIEFVLEREYLRASTSKYDDNYNVIGISDELLNSKRFERRKQRLVNSGSELYLKKAGETTEAYNERLNKLVYEDYLANQALRNTYNIWQLFRSGDNTIARELMDLIEDYKEIGDNTDFSILQSLMPDSITNDNRYRGFVNFKLRNYNALDAGIIDEYNKQWEKLADINDTDKLALIKDFDDNKYISEFFSRLPIYAFLQSGMDPSEFSLASTMPYDLYLPLIQRGKDTFLKKMESSDAKRILKGMQILFNTENAKNKRKIANRGALYNVKYENLPVNEFSLSELPFVTLQPNGIYYMEPTYVKNGFEYEVDKKLLNWISKNNPSVLFLTSPADIIKQEKKGVFTASEASAIIGSIDASMNMLKNSGLDIVVYREGFIKGGKSIPFESNESELIKNKTLNIETDDSTNVEEEPSEVETQPKLLKNEDGLIIIENMIPKAETIKMVEDAEGLIEDTSFKQTAGAVSWGYGMQWIRVNAMSPEQREGLVIGKQLNGKEITQQMKDDFINTGNSKGFPLYVYTTIDKNGKKLPPIPENIIKYLASIGIDASEYDASYNSVYDKSDDGSLIIHQDNTETNKSPIITISLGRPMKFITYELKDPNDFNVADTNNTAFRIATNAVRGEAIKLDLIPASAKDKEGNIKYGHFTPDVIIRYAEQIDEKKGTKLKDFVIEKLREQFKNAEKTEFTLSNGAVLVFSGNNRNVLHEIVFDPETNKEAMESGFPALKINKAFKGLKQADKIVKTNDYRVVLTLRKVEGATAKNVVNEQKLIGNASKTIDSKVIEGDIFALPGIPVITTNLGGVHGAGLAQAAKAKGLVKQGNGEFKATDEVVQLPVKLKWSDNMSMNNNMELLKESLRSLIKVAKEKTNNTYLLPLAGLGHGEGSVEDILPFLIKTVQASPNIKLVLPAEGVNLGRQGTVRKDFTRENMPKIKAMLAEAGLLAAKPQAPVSKEVRGNIQLELIEDLVQQGKAKTTVRNYDRPSGVYKSSKTNNLYNLVNRGPVKKVGDKIVGEGVSYTLDEFGAAEGFDNWAGFVKAAKFAGVDIQKGKEVFLYDISPAGKAPDTTRPVFDSLPEKSNVLNRTYAGIGSRQTPQEVLDKMTEVAKYLDGIGYTLQTGFTFKNKETGIDEEGADKAFSDGSNNKILFGPYNIRKTVAGNTVTESYNSEITKKSESVAKEIHPAPSRLTPGALKLMARNTNQVFGPNLDTTVDFVLFWAEEVPGSIRPKGGTGQAVEIARRKGIPTINLADPNWKKALADAISGRVTKVEPAQKTVQKEVQVTVDQYTVVIKPDGKMFYLGTGKEIKDQTLKNKASIRKEYQEGILRIATTSFGKYFVLSDNRILGAGTTNLGKETVKSEKMKKEIIQKAVVHKKEC